MRIEGVGFMRFIITGRNIEVTKALKGKIEEKLSRLSKFFISNTEVQVTLSVEKSRHIMEVTIPIKGSMIRAEVESEDMYANIDEVVDVVERQLVKHKNKLRTKHRNDSPSPFKENLSFLDHGHDEEDEEIEIVRSKKFALKPMYPEEACLEMDLLGHDFFVFTNGDTGEVNVVYKRRKQGTYGLIEPEF